MVGCVWFVLQTQPDTYLDLCLVVFGGSGFLVMKSLCLVVFGLYFGLCLVLLS